MANNMFSSCLLCKVSLSYNSPPRQVNEIEDDEDDEYESDEEDWRNSTHETIKAHLSCLRIATVAAGDRHYDIIAKLCHKPQRYAFFPLLTMIPDPSSDPNHITKSLALAIVRFINNTYWNSKFPVEICNLIAVNISEHRLGQSSVVPTLCSIDFKPVEQTNLTQILQNVDILLEWRNDEFWGERSQITFEKSCSIFCDRLKPQINFVLERYEATVVINKPRTLILYYNVASKQTYLSGLRVDGLLAGYKGSHSETLKVEAWQALLFTFNQWGFQCVRIWDGTALPSMNETAYAVHWPDDSTMTTVMLATFDACKCIGLSFQGGSVWTSRSVLNTMQSPRLLVDCSTSQEHLINWCLSKFDCPLSEIQVGINVSDLCILHISFKDVNGSTRSIGPSGSSSVFSVPISYEHGEILSYIRVCPSSKNGLICVQFETSFCRTITIGDILGGASWSSVDWPAPIYATYEIEKPGFCLFGTDQRSTTATNSTKLDNLTSTVFPSTHYVTATWSGCRVAIAQAPLYQLESLKFFQFRRRLMLGPEPYSFHICGVQLTYDNGCSIVLGQHGELFELIRIANRIAELKIWMFEDDEDHHIKGLEFKFESGVASQSVGTRLGPETKTFRRFETLQWATGNMFSDIIIF